MEDKRGERGSLENNPTEMLEKKDLSLVMSGFLVFDCQKLERIYFF